MDDLERVPNPASSVDGTTAGIDVEAAVREGTLTAEQGLGVLQTQMRAMEVRLEERLRAELASPTAPLESVARSVYARLTEAPTNW